MRGGKYSLFDGGTRVPFLASWPGTIAPGTTDALVCHVDLHASFAALTGQGLDAAEAPDSLNVLDALLGRGQQGRTELVVEGVQGKTLLRQDDWVFIPPHDGPAVNKLTNTELGNAPEPQLYDLSADLGQVRNVAADHGDIAQRMSARLEQIIASKQTRTNQ